MIQEIGSSTPPSQALPLAGIRVLDFGHTVMGPTCGVVLADLGATVTFVEPPEGSRTRRLHGFAAGFFGLFNRNKRGIALDLKHPRGHAVAERLIANSDVLLENFAPGTMARLGLDWEVAKRINPQLIYCALKGYLPGPYEDYPALDEVVQMQAGLAYMTGPRGRPLRAGAPVIDIMGGVFGVVAILAALRERDRTGLGQCVQSALFESTAFIVAPHMAVAAITGRALPPMPERVSAWCVYDVFQAQDGPVFVGITSEPHWVRFCATFPVDDLRNNPALATNDDRVRERELIIGRLQEVFGALPVEQILRRCRANHIPCAPVARPDELFDDAQLNATGTMLDIAVTDETRARLPGLPIRMGSRALPLRCQAPRIGEHTGEVLRELGMDEEEIASLAACDAVKLMSG
jgi:crotonobetainyl-CoA:carnitine CoA-transferase CaiB-like acyl-CoA transferase